jgi:hypothetical protein
MTGKQNGPDERAASVGRFRRPGSCSPPSPRMWAISLIPMLIALSACGSNAKLPPLPPRADLCILYTPWAMSAPAAAVETIPNLRAHAANQEHHHQKCLLGDRAGSLGPR